MQLKNIREYGSKHDAELSKLCPLAPNKFCDLDEPEKIKRFDKFYFGSILSF